MEFIQELPKGIRLANIINGKNSSFFKKKFVFSDLLEIDILENFDKSFKVSQEIGVFYINPVYYNGHLDSYERRFVIGIPFIHLPEDSQERIDAENIYIESGMFDKHDKLVLDIFSQKIHKNISFAEYFYNFFFKDIEEPTMF